MNKFLTYFNFTTIVFILLGFYYVSFLPDLGFPNEVTVVLRAVVAFFCLLSFLSFRLQKNYTVLFLYLFIAFYTFRLISDIYFKGLFLGKSPTEVIIFFFGVTIFPSLALLNKNLKESFVFFGKYIYFLFNFLSLFLLMFNKDAGRLSGNSVLNPITAGEIAVSCLLINFILFFKKRSFLNNILNLFFTSINLIVLIFSASRGPLVSLIVCLLIYLYINKKISTKIIFILSFFIFGIIYFVINYSDSLGLIFLDRMIINTGDIDKPEENRVLLWQEGYEIIRNNFFFGISTTTKNGYVHNFFLELLMSTGFFGLLIFLIPLMNAFKNLKKHLSSNNEYIEWIGLLFIQYFIVGLFSSMIYTNNYFFYFFTLVLTNAISKKKSFETVSLTKI